MRNPFIPSIPFKILQADSDNANLISLNLTEIKSKSDPVNLNRKVVANAIEDRSRTLQIGICNPLLPRIIRLFNYFLDS
jgi:hypothetical protein